MITLAYDESHHLTGFEVLFPDGEIRPAFLLTGLATFTDQPLNTRVLRRLRLREGTDFAVVNAGDLPDTVPNRHSMRGQRTLLSLSGLLQVVIKAGNTDFSDRLTWWITDEVVPAIMRDGYYHAAEVDQMVAELRNEVDQLRQMIDLGFGDMTLGDLAGWD